VDEIHRSTRRSRTPFYHAVEEGTLTLIGATTENPSFEVNAALLSRCKVLTLRGLTAERDPADIETALPTGKGAWRHCARKFSPRRWSI